MCPEAHLAKMKGNSKFQISFGTYQTSSFQPHVDGKPEGSENGTVLTAKTNCELGIGSLLQKYQPLNPKPSSKR